MKTQIATPESRSERQALLADLFHALHQPLTTLQCALELAEHQPYSEDQYRNLVSDALEQVEQVAELVSGLRELFEAEDPGESRKAVELGSYLQEAVEELLPVAESRQVKLALHYRALPSVMADPRRFRHALFHFIEGAIESAAPGSVVTLEAMVRGGQALLELTASREDDPSSSKPSETADSAALREKMKFVWWRLALAIAARSFEAVGGQVRMKDAGSELTVQVRLPRADAGRRG